MEQTIRQTYTRSISIAKDVVPLWEEYRLHHPDQNLNRLINDLLRTYLEGALPCVTDAPTSTMR
jgi:hypothetical protein